MMVADDSRWIQISLGWQGLQGPNIEFKTSAAQFIVLVPLKAISVIDLGAFEEEENCRHSAPRGANYF